jgi:hypothetical protein
MKLHEISFDYEALMQEIEENEGLLSDESCEKLTILQDQLEKKAESYALAILQIDSENDAIQAEIERLCKIADAKVKVKNKLKEAISKAMQLFERDKIKTNLVSLSMRESTSVSIFNESLLPDFCFVEKITKSPSKTIIKEMISRGEKIEGAEIVKNKNLQIK